jgi:hypothetical protein
MKKTITPAAQDDGHTVIEGTTPHDLFWSIAKLLASIGIALLAALLIDTLLSRF